MRQAEVFSSESKNCSATFSSAVFQQWFSSCHSSRCRSAFLNWWVVTQKWVVELFFRGEIKKKYAYKSMKKMFVIYFAGHTIKINNYIVYFLDMIEIGPAFLLLWNKFDFMIRKRMWVQRLRQLRGTAVDDVRDRT